LELEIFRAEISELRIIKQNFAVLVFEGSGEFQLPPPPRPIKVMSKKLIFLCLQLGGKKSNQL
jgi:hypothetical protein